MSEWGMPLIESFANFERPVVFLGGVLPFIMFAVFADRHRSNQLVRERNN